MTLRKAPPIDLSRPPKVQAWDPDPALLEKWTPGLRAGPGRESVTGSRTISILDVIGADGLTGEGVTARRVAADGAVAARGAAGEPVRAAAGGAGTGERAAHPPGARGARRLRRRALRGRAHGPG